MVSPSNYAIIIVVVKLLLDNAQSKKTMIDILLFPISNADFV